MQEKTKSTALVPLLKNDNSLYEFEEKTKQIYFSNIDEMYKLLPPRTMQEEEKIAKKTMKSFIIGKLGKD